jgi:hypothetical protein
VDVVVKIMNRLGTLRARHLLLPSWTTATADAQNAPSGLTSSSSPFHLHRSIRPGHLRPPNRRAALNRACRSHCGMSSSMARSRRAWASSNQARRRR